MADEYFKDTEAVKATREIDKKRETLRQSVLKKTAGLKAEKFASKTLNASEIRNSEKAFNTALLFLLFCNWHPGFPIQEYYPAHPGHPRPLACLPS